MADLNVLDAYTMQQRLAQAAVANRRVFARERFGRYAL